MNVKASAVAGSSASWRRRATAVVVMVACIGGAGCDGRNDVASDDAGWTGTLSAEPTGGPEAASERFDPATVDALVEALEDERRAIRFYDAVMERFGARRPFSNIIRAERAHEAALTSLLRRHGHAVPEMPDIERPAVPETFSGACAISVQAELDNVAMYDRLLAAITHPEARAVMERLRWASQERHLPAFRRHADRGGA